MRWPPPPVCAIEGLVSTVMSVATHTSVTSAVRTRVRYMANVVLGISNCSWGWKERGIYGGLLSEKRAMLSRQREHDDVRAYAECSFALLGGIVMNRRIGPSIGWIRL